jgi:dienelactone hydrolase
LQAESDDVLSALDFIRTLPFVDRSRLGIMGWSFGGIVTMFAVSRSGAFRAAVDQAGGALTWDGSAALREALLAAARQVRSPVLLMVAQNDRTTASITTLASTLQAQNPATELIIYPPFTPSRNPRNTAPGHLIFSEQGPPSGRMTSAASSQSISATALLQGSVEPASNRVVACGRRSTGLSGIRI